MSQLPSAPAGFKADISRILKYAPDQLIGREAETRLLHDAWAKTLDHDPRRPRVLTFVALGGEGKTSLVAKWAASLAEQDWPGCDAAFAWSFYSQGTLGLGSSDLFLREALAFFGDDDDKAFAEGPAGAYEKAQRLATVIGRRRYLLILDGLEPLQFPPTVLAYPPGQLKDQGIATLLKGLAANGHGLCVVTTRYAFPDLKAFRQTTAPVVKLLRLSGDAGVHLLKTLGVKGPLHEHKKLVEDVKGHALTLTLLGSFLSRAFHGDILERDRVKFEKADSRIAGGHAFRTMAAYEEWLLSDGDEEGRREVAVLRLMGLFDRPADPGCLHALLQPPAITRLTEPLVGLTEDDLGYSLGGLESANLLAVYGNDSGTLAFLDAHPLLREYFSKRIRERFPDAWRAAHERLFEHLCNSVEYQPEGLVALQPLYHAVYHGCQAGRQSDALYKIYRARILRGIGPDGFYSTSKLGAVGANLGALACFFDQRWSLVSPNLDPQGKAWLLNETAWHLLALGRLRAALEPQQSALTLHTSDENWKFATGAAFNLSELHLTLGDIAQAERFARDAVRLADLSGDGPQQAEHRYALAHVLHQKGDFNGAHVYFMQAEQRWPQVTPFHSGRNHWRCELLLTDSERASWRKAMGLNTDMPAPPSNDDLDRVRMRTTNVLADTRHRMGLFVLALEHLTLARLALLQVLLDPKGLPPGPGLGKLHGLFSKAVDGMRRTGAVHQMPRVLLTRAWYRSLVGKLAGPDSAQEDLDEAWEIAKRGPMRLHMVDIHLYRARLFFRADRYPWANAPGDAPRGPMEDLAAAEKLIGECGYHRRDEDLADARLAVLGEP